MIELTNELALEKTYSQGDWIMFQSFILKENAPCNILALWLSSDMELVNKHDSILVDEQSYVCSTTEKGNKAKMLCGVCKLYCLKIMIVHVVVVQSNISTAYDKKNILYFLLIGVFSNELCRSAVIFKTLDIPMLSPMRGWIGLVLHLLLEEVPEFYHVINNRLVHQLDLTFFLSLVKEIHVD